MIHFLRGAVSFIDSTVTPINAPEDGGHGQVIESDSLSDFYLHEGSQKRHRKKRHNHDVDNSEEGTCIWLLLLWSVNFLCWVWEAYSYYELTRGVLWAGETWITSFDTYDYMDL